MGHASSSDSQTNNNNNNAPNNNGRSASLGGSGSLSTSSSLDATSPTHRRIESDHFKMIGNLWIVPKNAGKVYSADMNVSSKF